VDGRLVNAPDIEAKEILRKIKARGDKLKYALFSLQKYIRVRAQVVIMIAQVMASSVDDLYRRNNFQRNSSPRAVPLTW
jgi:hypothetical protein